VSLEVFDSRTDIRNLFITPEIRARIMRFEAGQIGHGHTHDLGHEMFLVLEGAAEFTIAGQSAVVGPGQICVARAGEWHEIRTLQDAPMTLYLSVTPHLEPTHSQWDREGGTKLPWRYGLNGRPSEEPASVLLARHVAASKALAAAAAENAAAQQALASALHDQNPHAVVDQMTRAFQTFYAHLQEAERAWNDLAPAVAGDTRD
jgi:quercetin dioxygenase-like cupin family protein